MFHRKDSDSASENVCFSVIATERTLDLQATGVAMRDKWVEALQSAYDDYHRRNMVDFVTGECVVVDKSLAPAASVRGGPVSPGTLRRRPSIREVAEQPPTVLQMHNFKNNEQKLNFAKEGTEVLKFDPKSKPSIFLLEATDGKIFWTAKTGPKTGVKQYADVSALSPIQNKGERSWLMMRVGTAP